MKRFIIILLSLVVLLWGCGKDDPIPTPTEPPVQETEAIPEETGPEAIMDPEDVTKEPVKTETVYRVVRTSTIDENGEEVRYSEYVYDSEGRLSEIWEFGNDGEMTSFSSTVYLSETEYETEYTYGEFRYSVRFTCDEKGRVIHQERTEDGVVTGSTTNTYDEFGNILTTLMVYEDGTEIDMSYEYTCDGAGNPLTVQEYNGGELTGWQEKTYDSEGRLTEVRYFSPDGELMRSIVSTWEGSTQTDVGYDNNGNAYLTRTIVYDDHGNTLSQETWQEDMMISRIEFTYEEIEIIVD